MKLYDIAHSRTGDKGNHSNISLIPYDPVHFTRLVECVTEEAVAKWFELRKPTKVTRYLLPNLPAINFVLEDVLDGGVNQSLNLDTHGKSLSSFLLEMPIEL